VQSDIVIAKVDAATGALTAYSFGFGLLKGLEVEEI